MTDTYRMTLQLDWLNFRYINRSMVSPTRLNATHRRVLQAMRTGLKKYDAIERVLYGH